MTKLFKIISCIVISFLMIMPSYAESQQERAETVFSKWFEEGKIKGTGHLFNIVVKCDRKRLESTSAKLNKGEIVEFIYNFTFVQNTKSKEKSKIKGANISASVEKCIIDTYYKDVTFIKAEWMPVVRQDSVIFPAILEKGKQPIVPITPIGFAGPQ
jgi:hypothetical protein